MFNITEMIHMVECFLRFLSTDMPRKCRSNGAALSSLDPSAEFLASGFALQRIRADIRLIAQKHQLLDLDEEVTKSCQKRSAEGRFDMRTNIGHVGM